MTSSCFDTVCELAEEVVSPIVQVVGDIGVNRFWPQY